MENRLLIEIIFKKPLWYKFRSRLNLLFRKRFYPVQGRPFSFNLKIINTGDNIFSGATIKNIVIKPAQSQMFFISHTVPLEFKIKSLNPKESQEIYITELTTLLDGLLWIECKLEPIEQDQTIKAYQRDCGTSQIIDPKINTWGQEFFVLSSEQVSSTRLNLLVTLLTFLMAWEAVFGLRPTLIIIVNFLGKILSYVGLLLLTIKY